MPPAGTPVPAKIIPRVPRWVLPALWAVVILIGTSWPTISVGPDVPVGFDKVVHFSMYAVLAGLSLWSSQQSRSLRTLLLTIVGVALLAGIDEWHQSFIPSRSMSFLDWVADCVGALTGAVATRYLLLLAPRRQGTT